MPGTVVHARDVSGNTIAKSPWPHSAYILKGLTTRKCKCNKQVNYLVCLRDTLSGQKKPHWEFDFWEKLDWVSVKPCSCMWEEHSRQRLSWEQHAKCVQKEQTWGHWARKSGRRWCTEETESRLLSLQALKGLWFSHMSIIFKRQIVAVANPFN